MSWLVRDVFDDGTFVLSAHKSGCDCPTPGGSGQTGNRTLHDVLCKQDSLIAAVSWRL